ncbi:MAG: AAA family ATPase [Planctomycetota bacterium]
MRLARLSVTNYKAFEDFVFEPDPSGLTTVIGANGSGKTSLWEVLSLMSRLANGWQYEWLERQFRGRGRVFDWLGTWGVYRFRVLDLMKNLGDLAVGQGPSDSLTTTGDNIARILYRWKTEPNPDRLRAVTDLLAVLLERTGNAAVTWDVATEIAGGTVYPFVRVYQSDTRDRWHELAYGPDGFKILLLIVCALNGREDFVVIEEPETHLDPRLMDVVADLLKSATTNGKQVVVTTHSPLLAQELPVGSIRVLTGRRCEAVPETVRVGGDVLAAWLTDVLHEKGTAP